MRNRVPTTAHRFGIMLRVHRRHQYLRRIFDNFRKLAQGREVFISIQADRPTPEVAALLGKLVEKLPASIKVGFMESPFPLLERKERYMEALQIQYEHLKDLAGRDLQAAALWDDDFWLSAKGIRELRGHLDILEADRVEARSIFLWDTPEQHNTNFPPHWQALVFRVFPNDNYPLDYTVHCPVRAAVGSCVRLHNPILNAGYMDEEDRKLTWLAYRRAGKIDAHTIKLTTPPTLEKV